MTRSKIITNLTGLWIVLRRLSGRRQDVVINSDLGSSLIWVIIGS